MTGALAVVATGGSIVQPCTLSASLDATAVAGTANSSTVTVTVPAGNTGDISFENFIDVGIISTSRYNQNGAGLTTYTDPTTVVFTNGQSLLLQTNGVGAGESRTVTLRDVATGTVIATYGTVVHTGA